jgi:general secretion pathway protein L
MTVLLIAVRKDVVDAYLDAENPIGSGISGIEISATALANCLSAGPGRTGGDTRAFLSLSEDHVELGLVKKGLLHYSRQVTTDHQGESLRRLAGEELGLLGKALGPTPDFLEVVCCGLKGSPADLLGELPGVHFVPLDLAAGGIPSDALAIAYGLAVKGVRKTPMGINLLPADLRKKVSKTAYYTMTALIGLLVLMLLVWGGSHLLHQRRVAVRLESELQRLGAEVETIQRTRDEVKDLEGRMDALNALRQGHLPVLDILRELSKNIPGDTWFNKLSIVDGKGEVEGYADSASALIPVLAASPRLRDVAFLSPITKDKDGKEKFRIGFTVK